MNILELIQSRGIEAIGRFYSTYRGVVIDNVDPDNSNKVCVYLANVLTGITVWAYAKNQDGSPGSGFKWLNPKIGSIVYVEFENGDPRHPIWTYHGWAIGEIPDELSNPKSCGLITPNGNKIYLSEEDNILNIVTKGGISLKTIINKDNKEDEAMVTADINPDGVKVYSALDITIDCDKNITINGGNNLGLINIADLTQKINGLVKEVNSLIAKYNSHTHICSAPGSPSAVTTSIATNASVFNKDDYEDTKVTH